MNVNQKAALSFAFRQNNIVVNLYQSWRTAIQSLLARTIIAVPCGPDTHCPAAPRVISLYVGSSAENAKEDLINIIRENFESFTMIDTEGFYRGQYEPAWLIKLTAEDIFLVVNIAEKIRSQLKQEGVGIELDGHYFRCTATNAPSHVFHQITNQHS